MKKLVMIFSILAAVAMISPVQAGLTGFYYNLPDTHPDMQRWITGLDQGMVESLLSGPTPTLTPYGTTRIVQFDWWDDTYHSFTRLDSDADLQTNFSNNFFPTNDGLPGDPYHFAVHWVGQFYVAEDKAYNYSMGSDDDSWLFIDQDMVLDLGGVHGMSFDDYTINLTTGWHDIDIFFAERHTVASGFQLNFFSDLQPTPSIPEPATLILLGLGLAGGYIIRRKK